MRRNYICNLPVIAVLISVSLLRKRCGHITNRPTYNVNALEGGQASIFFPRGSKKEESSSVRVWKVHVLLIPSVVVVFLAVPQIPWVNKTTAQKRGSGHFCATFWILQLASQPWTDGVNGLMNKSVPYMHTVRSALGVHVGKGIHEIHTGRPIQINIRDSYANGEPCLDWISSLRLACSLSIQNNASHCEYIYFFWSFGWLSLLSHIHLYFLLANRVRSVFLAVSSRWAMIAKGCTKDENVTFSFSMRKHDLPKNAFFPSPAFSCQTLTHLSFLPPLGLILD